MIGHGLKVAYYRLLSVPMRINAWLYRRFRAPRRGVVRVHLGPGQKNYLAGWVNVDANFLTAKIDVWADIRYALPFPDASVDAFYSHHVIEHLPDSLLAFHFSELHRCLKPGGIVRVGGPNGEAAARKLIEGDAAWFDDFPDKRTSVGGRYANFILCRGEHLTILTYSYLAELAGNAGFRDIAQCMPAAETHYPALIDQAVLAKEWESTPDAPHTLIVEAKKPA